MPEISELMARPAPERFDGAAAWSQLPPDVQAIIGALALELALTWHKNLDRNRSMFFLNR